MKRTFTSKQICALLSISRKKLYKLDFYANSYMYGFEKIDHNSYVIDNYKIFNSISNSIVNPPTLYTLNGIAMVKSIKPSKIIILMENGNLASVGIKMYMTKDGIRYLNTLEKLILTKKDKKND